MWEWQLVSFQNDALWNTGIFNSWLDDVDRIIVKVVEDNALADSEVFVPVFDHWLLEVSVEFEYLNSKSQLSHAWMSVI